MRHFREEPKKEIAPAIAATNDDSSEINELRSEIENLKAQNEALQRLNSQLLSSDARLRSLMAADVLGVLILEPEGRVLEVNALFCHLAGRTSQEMCAMAFTYQKYIAPEFWLQHERQRKILWETAHCPPWETAFLQPNGERRLVMMGAALVMQDLLSPTQPRQIMVWALDLSSRKRFEDEIVASEQRMRTIVENLHEGLVLTDLNDTILYANQYMVEISGYEIDELVGQCSYKLFMPPEQWPAMEEHNQNRAAGISGQYESLMRRKDGTYWWSLINGSPLRNGRGEIIGTIGANTDITQRKEAELQQIEMAARLNHSNAELQSFAYAVSHDLKEPLRKVEAFGSRLENRIHDNLDDQSRDYLRRMREAARRMNGLIEGLLLYSRVATHARSFEDVDLNQVAHEVLQDFEIEIETSGAQIEIEHLPILKADARQMGQLLSNLISNALKFRRQDVPPHIKISGWTGETRCGFTLADNGRGFEPSEAERIFEIFARVDGHFGAAEQENKRPGARALQPHEGIGIGLTVCRRIVERHGGSIEARGEVGQGATFWVELPRVPHAL